MLGLRAAEQLAQATTRLAAWPRGRLGPLRSGRGAGTITRTQKRINLSAPSQARINLSAPSQARINLSAPSLAWINVAEQFPIPRRLDVRKELARPR
jgi:hypothetical protein